MSKHATQNDGLRAWVQRLDGPLRYESRVLEESYEAWRRGQTELHKAYELLKEERQQLDKEEEELQEARNRFEREVGEKWQPQSKVFKDPDERMAINVGGVRYETTVGVLKKDRFSLLAGIADGILGEEIGTPFIDRDWWIFRYILAFLRHGSLPDNTGLLRQLYVESAYYRLFSLRDAIEDKLTNLNGPKQTEAILEIQDDVSPFWQPSNLKESSTPAQIKSAAESTLRWAHQGSEFDPSVQEPIPNRNMRTRNALAMDELDGGYSKDALAELLLESMPGGRNALQVLSQLNEQGVQRQRQRRRKKKQEDSENDSDSTDKSGSTEEKGKDTDETESERSQEVIWGADGGIDPKTALRTKLGVWDTHNREKLLSPGRDESVERKRVSPSRSSSPLEEDASTASRKDVGSGFEPDNIPSVPHYPSSTIADIQRHSNSNVKDRYFERKSKDFDKRIAASRLPDPFGFTTREPSDSDRYGEKSFL